MLKDVCLFAHFDPDNQVDPYVLFYLAVLRGAGFSTVFITPSTISDDDEQKVRALCIDVVRRRNEGHDFGSWSDGFHLYKGRFTGRLLLANDSVYGPTSDLNELLTRLTTEKADFYGLVESRKIALHLQSWFLLFEPQVISSPAFQTIFEQNFQGMSKLDIVKNGEIKITQKLLEAGFHYHALVAFTGQHPLAELRFNPMHVLWREMLEHEKVPFLKVEVMRDRLPEHEKASAMLRLSTPLRNSVNNHLRRVGGKYSSAPESKTSLLHRIQLGIYLKGMRLIYSLSRNRKSGLAKLLAIASGWAHGVVKRR